MKIRLHQFLSRTGVFSSKNDITDAIRDSEVKIEGRIVTKPNFQFNKNKIVTWKDKKLELRKDNIYLILNKPEGYISTRLTESDEGKKSIYALLPEDNTLFAVGRLDEDTSGLLIITNDGTLGYNIASPESNIKKTYRSELAKELTLKDKEKIEKGVVIKLEENGKYTEYKTKPCEIKMIDEKHIDISITEGKKREVRRMFEAVGNKVIKLERIAIGGIQAEKLGIKKGSFKVVDKEKLLKMLFMA
jgi:23S rRNA pseudouridine2605 synthase